MTRLFTGRSLGKLLRYGCGCSLVFLLFSCSSTMRIQTDFVPPGSHRLAQVMRIASREEIVQAKEIYDVIRASGIDDQDIVDGSVVLARIYCCGGMTENTSSEKVNALMLYVPKELKVALGDIVEVRSGRPPEKGDAGLLNVVIQIVQKAEASDGSCWWDPKNDRLWLRILYCDWMPTEGWIKQGGLNPAWYLPAKTGSPGT